MNRASVSIAISRLQVLNKTLPSLSDDAHIGDKNYGKCLWRARSGSAFNRDQVKNWKF